MKVFSDYFVSQAYVFTKIEHSKIPETNLMKISSLV